MPSHKKYLPHHNVYTRLAPSPIHGVGVFAIRNIKKDTNIFSNDESEMIWISKKEVKKISKELKKLYLDFCVEKKDKFGCPLNFNLLTVGWYLNHSENPNVVCDDNYEFYALRNIKKDEELLSDYETYSIKRKLTRNC